MKITFAEYHKRGAEKEREHSYEYRISAAKNRAEAAKYGAKAAEERAKARENHDYPESFQMYMGFAADSESRAADYEASAASDDVYVLRYEGYARTSEKHAKDFESCGCTYDYETKLFDLCEKHKAERAKEKKERESKL